MADIKKDAERLVNYVKNLEEQGALLITKPQDVIPPTVGIFDKSFPEWQKDKQYKKNDLFVYQGKAGYVKQTFFDITRNIPTVFSRNGSVIWCKT